MKQKYICPQIKVFNIDGGVVLAGSVESLDAGSESGGGIARSKGNFDDDDDDD